MAKNKWSELDFLRYVLSDLEYSVAELYSTQDISDLTKVSDGKYSGPGKMFEVTFSTDEDCGYTSRAYLFDEKGNFLDIHTH